jgi:tetratricopeptide (TPR) repeat protein
MSKEGIRKRNDEYFLKVEASMIRKVKSEQINTGSFAFGLARVSIFAFILLLYCAFLLVLVGCESQEMKAAEAERARKLPPEARMANLQQALEKKFENPEAHFELAQLYQAEGQWAKAEYHYNIALSFDPTKVEAQAAMVKLFIESGDPAKSKNYAETYIRNAGISEIQSLRLAKAFQDQKLDDYAVACYQQALKLAPNSAEANKQVAYYYLNKDDKDRAKEYFVRSFQLDPNQPDVAGELGRLGVEVKIPGQTAAGTPGETGKPSGEKDLKMVMRHGRVEFEPTSSTSKEK